MAIAELDQWPARQAAARAEGRLLGLGFATFIEAAPGPPDFGALRDGWRRRRARRASPRGSCSRTTAPCAVFTQQMPHGQGHETTLAQVAADELGVPVEQVRVRFGDTAITPFGLAGTGGSRSAAMAGGAVTVGARALREHILDVAADLLEAAREDLVVATARVHVRRRAVGLGVVRRRRRRRPAAPTAGCPGEAIAHRRRLGRRRGRLGPGDARVLGRGRPAHRPRAHPAVRRGRGLRRAHQPAGRRRPDRGRRGAGHRRGALREDGLRRRRAAPDRHVHGLPAPDRGGGARDRDPPPRRRRATSRPTTAASARAA